METLQTLLVLGLLAPALCQLPFNPAMMSIMSNAGGGGGGAGGGMGSLGALAGLGMADMGGSMTDMLMMQALAGGGSGGAGGSAGGIDPMTLLMLGGGGAGGGSSDMMQTMMMLNMFNGNQGGGQQTSMATNIANMLAGPGGSSSDITPGQQNALWGVVQMSGNAQRIMDAVTTPTDRTNLERDGLPGVNHMMTMTMCPRPTSCGFVFCENMEIPFTAESFYVCRGCPRCRMDSSQRNMLNLMRGMGGSNMNPAQALMMARVVGGQSGAASSMSPEMMVALMNMQQQHQQQQQNPPTQSTITNPSPKPAEAPTPTAVSNPEAPVAGGVPKPPPEFIKAMREMSRQLRAQMMANKSTAPAPSPSAPTH